MPLQSAHAGPFALKTFESFIWVVVLAIVAAYLVTFGARVYANDATGEVIRLNRQGVESYNRLEVAQAQNLLRKALSIAKQKDVKGQPLARTLLNLGVVAVGGFSRADEGEEYFAQALKEDPSITVDPMLATPEIQSVFEKARMSRPGVGRSVAKTPAATAGAGSRSRLSTREPGAFESSVLTHVPAAEQLVFTSLPIYVEAPDKVEIAHIELFYRPAGTPKFIRTEMHRVDAGWGDEIRCAEVQLPDIEYYIVAYGKRRDVMGYVGSEAYPVIVPIVEQRTTPVQPALPGRMPPEQCKESCPPNSPGCAGELTSPLKGSGESCHDDNECIPDFVCSDEICIPQDTARSGSHSPPKFFIQTGLTAGFGYATQGMPSDSARDGTKSAEYNAGWITSGTSSECKYSTCVNVQQPGFVPTLAGRFTIGYYLSRRIALAGTVRYQFASGGNSPLASMLLGGRLQYLITQPKAEGVILAAHIGASVGQIQLHPVQPEGSGRPWARSGLTGIQLGSTASYRFTRNVGIFATPEFHFMFPMTLLNIDLTGGLELAF